MSPPQTTGRSLHKETVLKYHFSYFLYSHSLPISPFNPLLPRTRAAMDAIKKKMQAMKVEKDNAMDRSDVCEQAAKDAKVKNHADVLCI